MPQDKAIDALAKKAMDIIDINGSETIDFDEFSNWIKNDEEIQGFLIKYTGFHPLEHAVT